MKTISNILKSVTGLGLIIVFSLVSLYVFWEAIMQIVFKNNKFEYIIPNMFLYSALMWIYFKSNIALQCAGLLGLPKLKTKISFAIVSAIWIASMLQLSSLHFTKSIFIVPFIVIQLWGLKTNANFVVKKLRLY